MRVIDLSTLSMVGGNGIAEIKISLWWADGTSFQQAASTTAGSYLLADGVGTQGYTTSDTVFNLTSTWNSNTKFAFESTIKANSASYVGYCELWDMTLNSAVSGSQVLTTSTSFVVLRSGTFTLIAGHSYGVTFWPSNISYPVMATDASLIVFPQ